MEASSAQAWPGREEEKETKAHPPGSDEVITATPVAGSEMGSKEAETYEFVKGLLV